MRTRFEWDDQKARTNLKKHGISFQMATFAFSDTFSLMTQDRIEGGEYRWQTFGMVNGLLLMVAHLIWEEDDADGQTVEVIRIISAREADRKEKLRYEQQHRPI